MGDKGIDDFYKIGDIYFKRVSFNGDVILLKQLATGFPLILSKEDLKYDDFGRRVLENEDFISEYIESDITITANPIIEGRCDKKSITINKCDYSIEIREGTPLLDMNLDEYNNISGIVDSMKEAIKFYYKNFNGEIIKGFTSTSWLLNRNYRDILEENNSIKTLASMFYEYPIIFNDERKYEDYFNDDLKIKDRILKEIERGLTFENSSIIYPSYDMRKLQRFIK